MYILYSPWLHYCYNRCMSFLGLDFFESKETKKIKNDAYNKLYFPYGDKQKEKIVAILKSINNITNEEILYNYIVVKQELMKKDLKELNKEEIKELVYRMADNFITRNISSIPYIVLADEDIHIDSDLNYSSMDILNQKIDEIKAWFKTKLFTLNLQVLF